MNCLKLVVLLAVLLVGQVSGQQPGQQSSNYPYYLQSPLVPENNASNQKQQVQTESEQSINQRSLPYISDNRYAKITSTGRTFVPVVPEPSMVNSEQSGKQVECLYDKRYFASLDQCLAKRPYPTIGLPAFKNEDLLIKRGLSDKHGCVFILNNGLFKSYQITKYSLDSDSQCLDGSKVRLSINFSNVTLAYLWTLRCLNRADQLLEDATIDGKSSLESLAETASPANQAGAQQAEICVGSSQNFGFASLQLTGLEAQVELSTDIYKNWRVTNVTVAMVTPGLMAAAVPAPSTSRSITDQSNSAEFGETPILGTSIKDFVFETLDGDELNWRYLHLFQNWSRNRMHTNVVEQFRRFLWISLQRCLREGSERLPIKLVDVFANQRYNQ